MKPPTTLEEALAVLARTAEAVRNCKEYIDAQALREVQVILEEAGFPT